MVEKYNEWASSQHISQEVIFGIRGDLLAPSAEMEKLLQTSAYSEFDIIIISMALHHVADPKLMLKELVARMVDGGRILVIDWNKEEDTEYGEPVAGVLQKGDWKDVKRTIKKQRFSESEVVGLLKSAGCREVEFVLCDEVSKLPMEFGGKERMFFGLGRK
jgi:SAM-dependent methyltransferase